MISLDELGPHDCRWPDGEGASIRFCGARKVDGKPYCARHCRIAYRPPLTSRAQGAATLHRHHLLEGRGMTMDYEPIVNRRFAALIVACEQLGTARHRGATVEEIAVLNVEAFAALMRLVEIEPETRKELPPAFQVVAEVCLNF